MRLFVALLIAALPTYSFGSGYWSLELPVAKGATNVVNEKDTDFYIITTSYDLETKNTDAVYD